ncbi:GntR family transcriptional regulator [Shinella curvata]|uniref:GntR family transcriptional regulator n=1 Tax=Shinella curvata TaxID=1817964 RepID=A0ABT8XM31_9HYPH|nr:GntR family transcriptional regulator [Shinella curvata]MCJ8055795.1 GntR family transcriptional regulator [Shinella curvata]MDO6124783.1 GntR family transcriptional regulator [Shinella curvata]
MAVEQIPTEAGAGGDRKTALSASLRHRILTMQIAPGSVLDEIALSEEFGLSRPPVREAMRQLAGEGFIELEANRPARVTSMSYQSLRDFFLVAPLIYAATTRLAAEVATKADIANLKEIQASFRESVDGDDVDGRVFYNDQFHLRIGEVARNPYLLPSLRRLLIDHARIGKIFYRPASAQMQDNLEEACRQHDDIIDAIAGHDADRAEALVRAHLDLSRRNMAMYAAPEGMPVAIGV